MLHRIRLHLWLILPLLAWTLLLGVETLGCRYWAGPLPLGTDNDVRVASNLTSGTWAQPMDLPGLPNLHKVSDDLYRGAEPTPEGVQQLKKLGIKTVIDLRSSGSPDDLSGTGMTYVRIRSTAWQPEDKDVVLFLQTVTDKDRAPLFVHCRRGADRTGMMTAIYRVAGQGWTKEQAIAEMTQGGFGFYSGWQNLVRYIRDLDIERLKQSAVTAATHRSVTD
jgi:protein tyrosine phosphatase (PTP) superfamily phosphohydrolase (DUF442 family)